MVEGGRTRGNPMHQGCGEDTLLVAPVAACDTPHELFAQQKGSEIWRSQK